jgi:O-antigen ligase
METASTDKTPHPAERIARVAFFAALLLAPVRWRVTLLSRPNGEIYRDYTDFLLFLPDLAMLAALIAWGISRRFKAQPLRLGPAIVWIPLAGLTAVALLSSLGSVDPPLSLYHAFRLCLLFLFYLFIVNMQISLFAVGFAVGLQGIVQAVVAIPQSLLQHSIGLQLVGEYQLDPAWSGVSIVSDGATRFLRAYGLSDHPNILGGCLAFGMIVLLTVYLRAERKNSLIFGIVFVLLSLALLMTFSRSAWLAFFAGTVFILALEAKARGWVSLKSTAVLFVVAILVALPFVAANLNYFGARLNAGNSFEGIRAEAQATDERAYLNRIANQIFTKYPLTGVGMSASPVGIKREYGEFPTFYQPPHFALLAVALETGFFGAIFYLLLLCLPWIVFSRRADLRANPRMIGVMGLLLALTVVGFFDYYTWFSTPGRLWQWLAWGLFAVAMDSSAQGTPNLLHSNADGRSRSVVGGRSGSGEDGES